MRYTWPLVAAVSWAATAYAYAQEPAPYGRWGHDGWMFWGGHLFGLLWMILFIALIAGAVVLVRYYWHVGEGRGSSQKQAALELLDVRYARGEIDREEYLQRKKDLAG